MVAPFSTNDNNSKNEAISGSARKSLLQWIAHNVGNAVRLQDYGHRL